MTIKVKENGNSNGNDAGTVKEVKIKADQVLKAKLDTLETEYDALRKEAAALKAETAALKAKPKPEHPVLSLEKRIQKVEDLTIIIEKWRKLGEAKKNLTGFKLGADGLSSTVIIKDVSGKEFKTSHNIVVETVLKSVQEVLDEKIAEVEKKINFAM